MGSQASQFGAAAGDNHACPASLSVTATMGAEIMGTARFSEGGAGSKQPKRVMTQQERADHFRYQRDFSCWP